MTLLLERVARLKKSHMVGSHLPVASRHVALETCLFVKLESKTLDITTFSSQKFFVELQFPNSTELCDSNGSKGADDERRNPKH